MLDSLEAKIRDSPLNKRSYPRLILLCPCYCSLTFVAPLFPHHLRLHCNSYFTPHLASLQSRAWLLTVQQMCGMFYGRCECCRVQQWGCGGLMWALETAGCWVEIFLCTVEWRSEPPQQSPIFHGQHVKAGRLKNAWEGSLLTTCSYRFELTVHKRPQHREIPTHMKYI